MTILSEDRIIRFRERLYQKKIPRLLRRGAGKLNPIKKSKTNQEGRTIIATKEIVAFFIEAFQDKALVDVEDYFSSLYLYFNIMSKDAEKYTFETDVRISEKDIQEAGNKKTIEYLTTNLIISYFDAFSGMGEEGKEEGKEVENDDKTDLEKDEETGPLLQKNLKGIIAKSNEGRDYRTLVDNTLQALIKTLQTGKVWRDCLKDIQAASLVCRLAGTRLPHIDQDVFSKITLESRNEIQKYLTMFTKILNMRDQMIREEKNQKNFSKTMKKLDTATTVVLDKIDKYLGDLYTFTRTIGVSLKNFLGENESDLKIAVASYFFEQRQGDQKNNNQLINYSRLRFKMGVLFGYPNITKYAGTLQRDEIYQGCIIKMYQVYLNELSKQIETSVAQASFLSTRSLETCISETKRLNQKFHFKNQSLLSEKHSVQQSYLTLIRKIPLENMASFIELREDICKVIQDDTKELLEHIREVLIDSCCEKLVTMDTTPFSADELQLTIRKIIRGYSFHYKPQRFFFQRFFERYVGVEGESPSDFFSDLLKTKEQIGMALLLYFSDFYHVKGLLSDKQIDHAARLLKVYRERKKKK